MSAFLKNLLLFVVFLAISYLFFHLALDNGFWHSDDFGYIAHNLHLTETKAALFDSAPPYKFQPFVYGISYCLFHWFGLEPPAYFLFNILLHAINAFLVYRLVQTLLRDRQVAVLSGLLFVFTVGSYGKTVMLMSGLEDLLITMLTLLTMVLYFRNELTAGGKIWSPWFILAVFFFIVSMFTRSTSLSILGAFLAFNYFFRRETGRRVVSSNFIVLLVIAAVALMLKTQIFHYRPPFYTYNPGPLNLILLTGKNILSYLVRMIFPIHTSNLVTEAGPIVRFVYGFATAIRVVIALTVLSYSFFGFIFGNHAIRFFIAWTYIIVLPFAFFQFPVDWLNIRHLYMVSVGFVMVLSSGAVYCSRLIGRHRWRRWVPYLVPVLFVALARFIVVQLDHNYELKVASPETAAKRVEIAKRYPEVIIDGGRLRFKSDLDGDSR
ncbi:MAG: hypothetical protein PHD74_08865 [Candidatus Krumholzibacteria bacterium]|nr:hypothetical protein [Candidatus Krumholzibacteria bacterium]